MHVLLSQAGASSDLEPPQWRWAQVPRAGLQLCLPAPVVCAVGRVVYKPVGRVVSCSVFLPQWFVQWEGWSTSQYSRKSYVFLPHWFIQWEGWSTSQYSRKSYVFLLQWFVQWEGWFTNQYRKTCLPVSSCRSGLCSGKDGLTASRKRGWWPACLK